MVEQIGIVSSDIRAHIDKIEEFLLLQLEDDRQLPMTANKQDSNVRYLVPRPSTCVSEDMALAITVSSNTLTSAYTDFDGHEVVVGRSVTFDNGTSLPIREYFQLIDRQRDQKVRRIKQRFESIGPILVKLESLILGTFTGRSSEMKLCYESWENELLKLLFR